MYSNLVTPAVSQQHQFTIAIINSFICILSTHMTRASFLFLVVVSPDMVVD